MVEMVIVEALSKRLVGFGSDGPARVSQVGIGFDRHTDSASMDYELQ